MILSMVSCFSLILTKLKKLSIVLRSGDLDGMLTNSHPIWSQNRRATAAFWQGQRFFKTHLSSRPLAMNADLNVERIILLNSRPLIAPKYCLQKNTLFPCKMPTMNLALTHPSFFPFAIQLMSKSSVGFRYSLARSEHPIEWIRFEFKANAIEVEGNVIAPKILSEFFLFDVFKVCQV